MPVVYGPVDPSSSLLPRGKGQPSTGSSSLTANGTPPKGCVDVGGPRRRERVLGVDVAHGVEVAGADGVQHRLHRLGGADLARPEGVDEGAGVLQPGLAHAECSLLGRAAP